MSDFNFDEKTNVEIKAMGKLAEGFTVIPNNIMNDIPNITADGFTIFAKILQYINSDKNKISVLGMAKLTGLSKGKVSKGLNKLIELGYIERKIKWKNNIKNGYIYEIYGEPKIREKREKERNEELHKKCNEKIRESIGNSRRPENWDTESGYPENTYNKKEKEKKEKEKKEKKVVVVDSQEKQKAKFKSIEVDEKLVKENMILEIYKTYKLQARVMPQMKKLLLAYADKMDLGLYEEIFMLASEDNVKSKYKYIKELLEKFDSKGIYTLESYKMDCKKFKEEKQVNTSKDKSKAFKDKKNNSQAQKIVTRFHNINQRIDNYSQEELEETLLVSQSIKFGDDNLRTLYARAIKKGLNSLHTEQGRIAVVKYAEKRNLEVPN